MNNFLLSQLPLMLIESENVTCFGTSQADGVFSAFILTSDNAWHALSVGRREILSEYADEKSGREGCSDAFDDVAKLHVLHLLLQTDAVQGYFR